MPPEPKNADGKWIVLKNGQRIGPTYENQGCADQAAQELRKLCEAQGEASPIVEVKQLLMG